jgi:hypothetical protein
MINMKCVSMSCKIGFSQEIIHPEGNNFVINVHKTGCFSYIRFEVLTEVIIKNTAFRDMLECYQHSEGTLNQRLKYQTHLLYLTLNLKSPLHLDGIKTLLGGQEVQGPLVSLAHLLHLEYIE